MEKFYNIDECLSEERLFDFLNQLKDDEKIQFKSLDSWTIQIVDHDMTAQEEDEFNSKLNELCVYPDSDYDNDFWGITYDDFD